jgi:hypothetical protein
MHLGSGSNWHTKYRIILSFQIMLTVFLLHVNVQNRFSGPSARAAKMSAHFKLFLFISHKGWESEPDPHFFPSLAGA